ncbi:MAG: hypothetical protein ACI8PZ_006790 [Myxococcota bacterium]|jgi:hypothetical protein
MPESQALAEPASAGIHEPMLCLLLLACAADTAPKPADSGSAGSTAPAEPAPAWSAPDALGPYAVGTHTDTVDSPDGPLTVEVWYPASPAADAVPSAYGDLSVAQSAFRDAPPDRRGAPYPVVAFSHGFGGVRYQSAFLTEYLASHGLVVVAVDHPGHTLFDLDPDRTAEIAVQRPGQVAAAVSGLDGLAEPYDGLGDTARYAVVGHSFGAFTALVVGGGRLDPARAADHCATTPTPGCGFIDGLALAGADQAAPDPRAVVTVALAPGGHFAFVDGPEGLAAVRRPLLIAGSADADLPYDSEARPVFDELGPEGRLATLVDGGHWAFTDLCLVTTGLLDCIGPPDWMDPERVRALTQGMVTAQVRAFLIDSEADLPWTEGAAWAGDDVTWEP